MAASSASSAQGRICTGVSVQGCLHPRIYTRACTPRLRVTRVSRRGKGYRKTAGIAKCGNRRCADPRAVRGAQCEERSEEHCVCLSLFAMCARFCAHDGAGWLPLRCVACSLPKETLCLHTPAAPALNIARTDRVTAESGRCSALPDMAVHRHCHCYIGQGGEALPLYRAGQRGNGATERCGVYPPPPPPSRSRGRASHHAEQGAAGGCTEVARGETGRPSALSRDVQESRGVTRLCQGFPYCA